MAVGAQPADIVALIGRQSFILAVTLIYGLSPSDPASLAAAAILVGLVTAPATIFPAMRAAGLQPASTLRQKSEGSGVGDIGR
jgi:ABC-type lipoprotein release transport system permease subunit